MTSCWQNLSLNAQKLYFGQNFTYLSDEIDPIHPSIRIHSQKF